MSSSQFEPGKRTTTARTPVPGSGASAGLKAAGFRAAGLKNGPQLRRTVTNGLKIAAKVAENAVKIAVKVVVKTAMKTAVKNSRAQLSIHHPIVGLVRLPKTALRLPDQLGAVS